MPDSHRSDIKFYSFKGSLGGAALQGCVQQIGKLLSQSAKLDWLKITHTEETKIDFLNN
jgi:hypothetical protein